jgi:hypothetical protein
MMRINTTMKMEKILNFPLIVLLMLIILVASVSLVGYSINPYRNGF